MPCLRRVQVRWIERRHHAVPFKTHDGHLVYLPPDVTIFSGKDVTIFEVRHSDVRLETSRLDYLTVVEYNAHEPF